MRRTLLLTPLLLFGCGNSPAVTTDGAPAQDLTLLADLSGGGAADLVSSTYPPGPYGNTVGAIIPPLVWEGYPDPLADAIATSKTYGPYTMDDLRQSGRPYAAVHVAEFF